MHILMNFGSLFCRCSRGRSFCCRVEIVQVREFRNLRNFARLQIHNCIPLHFLASSSPKIFYFLHLCHNYSRFLGPSFNTPLWTLIGLTLSPSLTPLFKPPIFLSFFISNYLFSLERKHFSSHSLHLLPFSSPGMAKTSGGHSHKPRVRTSSLPPADGSNLGPYPAAAAVTPPATAAPAASQGTPTVAAAAVAATSHAPVPAALAPRRYDTRVGPTPPSSPHSRPTWRAPPSKRARTSSLGESSSSRPQEPHSPPNQGLVGDLPLDLSPASIISQPIFHYAPIIENSDCSTKDLHSEVYYDLPSFAEDLKFKDSMRLVQRYSLEPFMTPRQFFYP